MAKFNSWLDEHLETFVKVHAGIIPNVNPKDQWVLTWTKTYLDSLKEIWEGAKKRSNGMPILFPGRDVWQLEILARLDGWDSVFRPDISGTVAAGYATLKPKDKGWEDFSHFYCVDTGFAGSVPKALGVGAWDLISPSNVIGAEKIKHTILAGQPYDNLAATLEGAPKYWERATWDNENKKSKQRLSTVSNSLEYFLSCAQLTMHIVKYCSPVPNVNPVVVDLGQKPASTPATFGGYKYL